MIDSSGEEHGRQEKSQAAGQLRHLLLIEPKSGEDLGNPIVAWLINIKFVAFRVKLTLLYWLVLHTLYRTQPLEYVCSLSLCLTWVFCVRMHSACIKMRRCQ